MKKYVGAILNVGYSLIRFFFIKISHLNGFKFSLINLFSPFTEISLGNKSFLLLERGVRAKSGVKLKIRENAQLLIGENTSFNHGCLVISHEKITIGKNVQIGPNVLIYDHDHNYRNKNGLKNLEYKKSPVSIGNNVWIGANVVILKGTVIGDNCVVGAGAIIKGQYGNNNLILQERKINVQPIVRNGDINE